LALLQTREYLYPDAVMHALASRNCSKATQEDLMYAVTHPVDTPTNVATPSRPNPIWRRWRVALAWLAACVVLPFGLAACGGSDSVAPTTATSVTAVIDAAGGTVTGPDGIQVIIPPGALSQATTIGIARSVTGAPDALEAFPVAGNVYEFTPHDVIFNSLVTIRAPVPSGASGTNLFMASLGQNWKQIDAVVTNGVGEWQRNSFSFGYYGTGICSVPTVMINDPYWCVNDRSSARISATPTEALTQTSVPILQLGDAGSYRVDQAATLQMASTFEVAGNCRNVGVSFLRSQFNANTSTWSARQVVATQSPTLVVSGGKRTGTATFPLGVTSLDNGKNRFAFVVQFECPKVLHANSTTVTGWDPVNYTSRTVADGMIVEVNIAQPAVTYTIGGTVSGLTGTGLDLYNNGTDIRYVDNNGAFTFTNKIGAGSPYAVTVKTQPVGQTCTVTNGSGTANADVNNIAVTCGAATAAKAWRGAALIETNNAGGAEGPEIAFDANGDAFAIWYQSDGTRNQIWANRYTPAGWQTPQLLSSGLGDAYQPHIALDANGLVIAVWAQTDGTNYNIWARPYAEGVWGTPELIETELGNAFSPRVAFDAASNAIVVWSQTVGGLSGIHTNRFTYTSNTWGSATTIDGGVGPAYQPQVAVLPGGWVVAVWIQNVGGLDHIFTNTFNGTGWSTADVLDSNNNGGTVAPHLAADANGNAIAVWSQGDGVKFNAYTSRFSAGSWGLVELLETSNVSYATAPRIAMNAAGNAVAVWLEDEMDNTNVWARHYTAGVGWGTTVLIDSPLGYGADSPNVAIDPAGHATAIWPFRGYIYANHFTAGTGWGTPEKLETVIGGLGSRNVAMDVNGNAIAVWGQSDGTRPNIWANVYK
jgi:hypothetical protein